MEEPMKGAAATALVAYVLGLLATALYLYQLDTPLPDLDALKPRFVYTGVVIQLCLAFAAFVPLAAWALTKPSRPSDGEPRGKRSWGGGIGFGFFLLFVELVAYAAVVQGDNAYTDSDIALRALWLVVSATGAGLCAIGAWAALRADERKVELAVVAGLAAAGFLVWFLVLFGRSVFPNIPEHFGGSESRRAQLLIAPDGREQAAALGIQLVAGSLSAPLTVLYEGDTYYVLELDRGGVVQFSKDQVLGGTSDSKAPRATGVRTRDVAGLQGVPEPRDQLILSFSEPVDPATVIPGWDGGGRAVTLRVTAGPERGHDQVDVMDESRKEELAFGTVEFRFGAQSTIDAPRFARGHAAMTGSDIVITLDEPLPLTRPRAGMLLFWTPSDRGRDRSGNPVVAAAIQEPGDDTPDLDPEF